MLAVAEVKHLDIIRGAAAAGWRDIAGRSMQDAIVSPAESAFLDSDAAAARGSEIEYGYPGTATLAAPASRDDAHFMTPDDPPRVRRLVPLRSALLAFAVLASAGLAAVLGFAIYLFAEGYSGGSNPQSVAPLAFPLSFLVLIVPGLPAALICAAAWAGYFAAERRSRQSPR